jgi:RNA polymerase primary sigma factor
MNSEPKRRNYLVSNEEILLLVEAWQIASQKDKNALANKLLSRLGFLVHSRVRAHKGSPFYDDLLQEGRLGIMRALEDFRSERGRNFFMFATWHIQTRVRRFLIREARRRETPVGDAMLCESAPMVRDELEVRQDQKAIMQALSFLPDTDRRVLVMRFGFDGEKPRTFQQIGNALGISKQRAQQIEAGALQRLRKNRELKQLFL